MNNALRPRVLDISIPRLWNSLIGQRKRAFGFMILGALLAFEIFNFSTTEFALHDVLGELQFIGMKWATILSIAFCGIDFAGIARIFTPEQGSDEPMEVWYLFGAWILAAAMNATLTWWGVSVAIASHASQGASIVGSATINNVVPVFVAIMVWVIRILIIGTFSVAGEHLFDLHETRQRRPAQSVNAQPASAYPRPEYQNTYRPGNLTPRPQTASAPRPSGALTPAAQLRPPAPRQAARPDASFASRSEPTYHDLPTSRDSYAE